MRTDLENALARIEERLRVRLHQAANRMEDADPVAVRAALAGVRMLDVVDRLTGFRGRHNARFAIRGAEPPLGWATKRTK